MFTKNVRILLAERRHGKKLIGPSAYIDTGWCTEHRPLSRHGREYTEKYNQFTNTLAVFWSDTQFQNWIDGIRTFANPLSMRSPYNGQPMMIGTGHHLPYSQSRQQ